MIVLVKRMQDETNLLSHSISKSIWINKSWIFNNLNYYFHYFSRLNHETVLKYYPEHLGRIIDQNNCQAITGYTEMEILKFTGVFGLTTVPRNVSVDVLQGKYPLLDIICTYDSFQISINIDFEDNLIINSSYEGTTSTNTIYRTFVSQVKYCRDAGVKEIRCIAVGNLQAEFKYEEYYYLALLGFIPTKPYNEKFLPIYRNFDPNYSTLTELLQTREGRNHWERKGQLFVGVFDMKLNSESDQTLRRHANLF